MKRRIFEINPHVQANSRFSYRERWERGKEIRSEVPWDRQSEWERSASCEDPIALIQEHDKWRLPFLLPIKYGRMAASPFGFLRGAAAVMAADLSSTPVTGLETMLCGDAHLSNFGLFASPERKLIFDLNDFDETYPGPWEWDLKRLAASVVVVGEENGFDSADNYKLAKYVAKTYRKAISTFAKRLTLEIWYSYVDARNVLKAFQNSKEDKKLLKKAFKEALKRTQQESLDKYTMIVDGHRQFLNKPPLMVRLTDAPESEETVNKLQLSKADLEKAWHQYVSSVEFSKRELLSRYRIVDTALRVVGVGSVGTRCFVTIAEANSAHDAIVLQQKEAGPSVLEPYLKKREFTNHADRVVSGQRLMQSESSPFLGWSVGLVSGGHDYYWRQLWDMKGSVDVSRLDYSGLKDYLGCCSYCLALAHARSGDVAGIAGYLDNGKPFDAAIADFSVSYAEQTNRDHQALLDAIITHRIIAQKGV